MEGDDFDVEGVLVNACIQVISIGILCSGGDAHIDVWVMCFKQMLEHVDSVLWGSVEGDMASEVFLETVALVLRFAMWDAEDDLVETGEVFAWLIERLVLIRRDASDLLMIKPCGDCNVEIDVVIVAFA